MNLETIMTMEFLRPRRLRNDRRGFALPLALIGLIVVTVGLTTVIVTSTTELAMGNAHRDATGSMYLADAGLESYIGSMGGTLLPAGTSFAYTVPNTGRQVQISVERLHQVPLPGAPTPAPGGTNTQNRVVSLFAIRSQSMLPNGQLVGRPVTVMLEQQEITNLFQPAPVQPPPTPATIQGLANSAITLGGNLHVNGNAFWVSGRKVQGDNCAAPGKESGVQAVEKSKNSVVTTNNEKHMENFVGAGNTKGWNAIISTELDRQELIRQALGLPEGMTLDGLVASIPSQFKYGPMFGRPGFPGTMPEGHQVAIVDAANRTIDLRGGQGIIIILNGNVQMRGNAKWYGMIIVEGSFTLSGTPTIEGALISLSMARQVQGNSYNYVELTSRNAIGNGNILVQYHQCAINNATEQFQQATQQNPPPATPPTEPTTTVQVRTLNAESWMEVVR